MNIHHTREMVVAPALKALTLWSAVAEELVLATGYYESNAFDALRQYKDGPARGPYQMEPPTFRSHWQWHQIPRRGWLIESLLGLAGWWPWRMDKKTVEQRRVLSQGGDPDWQWGPLSRPEMDELVDALAWNHRFAAGMCRAHYYLRPEPLPPFSPDGLAAYWKDYYNTHLGKGTVEKFKRSYSHMKDQERRERV